MIEPISGTAIAATTAKLVTTGACLALGFWLCKKLTNQIDYFIFIHSKEYKETVAKEAAINEL